MTTEVALPVLGQKWASLGASHAPADDVAADSPRIAAALNTLASYVDAAKGVYIYAQASGRRINVFRDRSQLMQSLSFDDVPGGQSAVLKGVSSVAISTDAPGSDHLLLVASFGSILAVWRLDALNMSKLGQAPMYGAWRLDSTLPLRGQLVSTVHVWRGMLAVGSNTCIAVWKRGTYVNAPWKCVWSARTPRPLLRVQWSHDGQFLAAVPLCDTRVMVWRMHNGLQLVSQLRHARPIHALQWRRAARDDAPVLVVMVSNLAAYVYATMPGRDVFCYFATIDAASAVDDVSEPDVPCRHNVVSLMYCDAYSAGVALQHDIQQLEQLEQLALTGMTRESDVEVSGRRRRLAQLRQYLDAGYDLFFGLLADGSLVVHALYIQPGALWHTLFVLKIPPCISVELSHAPLMLEFVPLAKARDASGTPPTALIHGQTASGLRGTMSVSLCLLLDGDVHGLFVQDTIMDTPHTLRATHSFLHAEHRSDIVSLEPSLRGTKLLSFSRDGVMIWWDSCTEKAASLVSQAQFRLRSVYAVCAIGDGPNLFAVDDEAMYVALFDKSVFADEPTFTQLNSVAMLRRPFSASKEDVVLLASIPTAMGELVVLALRTGDVHVWTCRKDAAGWVVTSDGVRHLPSMTCAALVAWPEPVLLTVSSGTLTVWDATSWTRQSEMLVGEATHIRTSTQKHVALCFPDRVCIHDLRLAPFAYTLVHVHEGAASSVAWTTVGDCAVLAVSARQEVVVLGPHHLGWSPLARVRLEGVGSACISHVAWIDAHRLLVASTCQLFLFDAENGELESTLTHASHTLPYYDATSLLRCAQFGFISDAHATLAMVEKHARLGVWGRVAWTLARGPLADLRVDDAVADRTDALGAVVRAMHHAAQTEVDECGKQFLLAWYASDRQSAPLVWGQLSQTQEALLGKVASAWSERMSWPVVRDAGVFLWVHRRAPLLSIMEQVARASFTQGDDIDPVRCSLFCLAMRKRSMLMSVWRRAIGHRDQAKMLAFLAHDFDEERWRVAAQKNAYALMSQRRFAFAAMFFLLGDALLDAVHVCAKQLGDVALALAVARAYEEDDCGDVFRRVVRQHAIPHARERGDRTLAVWAHLVLGEHTEAVHALMHPLGTYDEARRDLPDPSMLLILEHMKTHAWSHEALAPHDEMRAVSFYVRLLAQSGCDWHALGMLRAWSFARGAKPERAATPPPQPVSHKVGTLMGERRPPPAQAAAEFDMSAFGF